MTVLNVKTLSSEKKRKIDVVLTYCFILKDENCKPVTLFKRSFTAAEKSDGVTGASVSITKQGESIPLVERLCLPMGSNPASVTVWSERYLGAAPSVCTDNDKQHKMAMYMGFTVKHLEININKSGIKMSLY